MMKSFPPPSEPRTKKKRRKKNQLFFSQISRLETDIWMRSRYSMPFCILLVKLNGSYYHKGGLINCHYSPQGVKIERLSCPESRTPVDLHWERKADIHQKQHYLFVVVFWVGGLGEDVHTPPQRLKTRRSSHINVFKVTVKMNVKQNSTEHAYYSQRAKGRLPSAVRAATKFFPFLQLMK